MNKKNDTLKLNDYMKIEKKELNESYFYTKETPISFIVLSYNYFFENEKLKNEKLNNEKLNKKELNQLENQLENKLENKLEIKSLDILEIPIEFYDIFKIDKILYSYEIKDLFSKKIELKDLEELEIRLYLYECYQFKDNIIKESYINYDYYKKIIDTLFKTKVISSNNKNVILNFIYEEWKFISKEFNSQKQLKDVSWYSYLEKYKNKIDKKDKSIYVIDKSILDIKNFILKLLDKNFTK